MTQGDEAWLHELERTGFSDIEIEEIYCELTVDLSSQHGACEIVIRNAVLMHLCTWSSIEGIRGVIRITRATLAGLPLADVMYIASMVNSLGKLRSALDLAELVTRVESPRLCDAMPAFADLLEQMPPEIFLANISYIDDAVIPVVDAAENILNKIAQINSIAAIELAKHRMELIFKPGKSETIVARHGTGAIAHRQRLETANNLIEYTPRIGPAFQLRVVLAYKHLGTQTVPTTSSDPEAMPCAAMCGSEIKAMRKSVLGCPNVSNERKLLLLQSHVLSKVCSRLALGVTLVPLRKGEST